MIFTPLKATHQQTKTYNQQLVFKTIYDHGIISRAEVARQTDLARVTVSEIVADLLDKGLVAEVGRGPSAGGKAPILLSVVDDAFQMIGVDIADEELCGAVLNLRGATRCYSSEPLLADHGDAALSHLYALLDDLVVRAERPLLGIGVGTPGLLDTTQGIVRRAVNLGWKDLPLGRLLKERYLLPVYVANDSQVTALAEHTFGAGKGEVNLAVIHVGLGIGAGIILNRQLFQGDGYGAGEIGHIAYVPNGDPCRCGNTGCIETVGSAAAIVRRARALAPGYRNSDLHQMAPSRMEITLDHVRQAFLSGDPLASEIVQEAARAVGFAAACLISALSIHKILLTGSVARLGLPWLEMVREEARRRALVTLAEETVIDFGGVKEDAVILGASALLMTEELGLSLVR
jgi:predicted NBD/HSP70 family sugar kinase